MNSWQEEDSLTVFLFICVICHGVFFVREWLILGMTLIVIFLKKGYKKGELFKQMNRKENRKALKPVAVFLVMIILSLAGLLQPVRSAEGWLEAWRWLIFLVAYLWGRKLTVKIDNKDIIIQRILFVAVLTTFFAWLPGSEMIWNRPSGIEEGRFVATFGYANAAAVFFGCQLLLLLKDQKLKLLYLFILIISIISTGSRAAIVLLLLLSVLLWVKRAQHKKLEVNAVSIDVLGFYQGAVWSGQGQEIPAAKRIDIGRILGLFFVLLLLQQASLYGESALGHLLDWTNTTLPERLMYYKDSLKLAVYGNFLPQAGGWLAFPFIQTISYWTLHPHSSFCQIMLNQGLAGVLILGLWAVKGLKCYIRDLIWGKDLTVICSKTAILYLGIHSLFDVDLSFGILGILFWLLVGMNSK